MLASPVVVGVVWGWVGSPLANFSSTGWVWGASSCMGGLGWGMDLPAAELTNMTPAPSGVFGHIFSWSSNRDPGNHPYQMSGPQLTKQLYEHVNSGLHCSAAEKQRPKMYNIMSNLLKRKTFIPISSPSSSISSILLLMFFIDVSQSSSSCCDRPSFLFFLVQISTSPGLILPTSTLAIDHTVIHKHGDSCLTSSANLSMATPWQPRGDQGWHLLQSHFHLKPLFYFHCARHCCSLACFWTTLTDFITACRLSYVISQSLPLVHIF